MRTRYGLARSCVVAFREGRRHTRFRQGVLEQVLGLLLGHAVAAERLADRRVELGIGDRSRSRATSRPTRVAWRRSQARPRRSKGRPSRSQVDLTRTEVRSSSSRATPRPPRHRPRRRGSPRQRPVGCRSVPIGRARGRSDTLWHECAAERVGSIAPSRALRPSRKCSPAARRRQARGTRRARPVRRGR